MEFFLIAIRTAFSPVGILVNMIGVLAGIIFGALPGLNGVVGVALLLPLTYNMSPAMGLIILAGLYMGSSYGGSISAILLNCPGTGEAACTALNGNPLAKQGRAKEALFYSCVSSGFGGLFGVTVMMLFTPILAAAALRFGPAELFLVSLLGLAVVGSLMGKNIAKGFFAVAFGLILSIVGMDATSVNYRFTFSNYHLQAGISLIPLSVGCFAIAEMLTLAVRDVDSSFATDKMDNINLAELFRRFAKRWRIIIKSSIIGTIIGILPGTGGAIASFIAYGEAMRTSKESSQFGNGAVDGIIAPECANNAAVGGSFVPLLSLGIPGSSTSAIIFGALTIHGMIPGPKLFSDNADAVYALMLGLFLSVIFMVIYGLSCTNFFTKFLKIKTKYIIPAVIVFAIFGAYSARGNEFDILLAIIFGAVGLLFKKNSIPVAPAVLGMILGSMTEQNLRQAMTIASAKQINIILFTVARPISIVVIILIVLILWGNMKTNLREK
ncbi:MAG: tripartite tricarboxylate transporter permease [Spirochaetales bacterium]|nr:tripartite tricarboxylate transporter permease [Spirochaetales bacterium]